MTTMQHWLGRFWLFWASQTIGRVGNAFSNFALVWWVAKTYGTATSLATGTLISMLPSIVLGPFIGTVVDRLHRKTVIVLANTTFILSAAMLFFLAETQTLVLWHLYLVMFLNSLAGQFHYLAVTAATTLLVPNDQLQRVSGISQLREGAVLVMAPPVGALLLELIRLDGILLLEVITAAIALVIMLGIRIPDPPAAAEESAPEDVFTAVRSGYRYIAGWPGMVALMAVAMVLNLFFNPAFSLMPLLVKSHFGGGVTQLAWMETGFGAGMIAGSVVLSVWGGFRRKVHTLALGVSGMGIATVILGLLPHDQVMFGIAAMVLVGITQPLTQGPLMAIIQGGVELDMQGRVMGFLGTASGIISPIGLLLAGPVSDWLGVQIWYLIAGMVALAATPLTIGLPVFRDLDDRMAKAAAASTAPLNPGQE